ncbi:MAG: hypothetical protein A2V63_09535 [Candidatus Eisenbacteria bacterium RBG_19FT_COMBO_70_11]|nr:MAG: hypothetical protein A2V63_09535 [Candidatus Eisenbacteria bacterium RBG_19FT_COMBO_70_11]
MPALIQLCIVIATIGLLVIAAMTVRMMTRFDKATEELSRLTHALRESVVKINHVTEEARALATSLRDWVPPVQRVLDRFEVLGHRAADLSSIVFEEFEQPVFTAAAVAHGVRSGANHLLKRLMHRFTHRNSPLLGGNDHE